MAISNEVLFLTQVVSIIGFVLALFVLYALLVRQKDATIQLLKERVSLLRDQVADGIASSPDMLAQRLSGRISTFEEELKRLEEDKTATEEQVAETEAELAAARAEAEALTRKIDHARAVLKDYSMSELRRDAR